MWIKSLRNFRTSIKNEKPDTRGNRFIDEHFVGTYNSEDIKGFFGMYHGIKEEPAKFLASTAVKIAADEQAIYEFLQNAVDCQSSHFFIFYNDDYFLAINNGLPFKEEDVKAILNFGQSNKGNSEIGSFGVGFKLTHRLVGKNDGVEELIKQYKGPIVFSWSNQTQLSEFLRKNIGVAYYNEKSPDYLKYKEIYNNAAWLFKICLTNFPTYPNEKVKNLDYEENLLFTEGELEELISFLKENLDRHKENFNSSILSQGSLFFLRLGEGKRQYLDKNYEELERGIAYSLNTFSKLSKVFINDHAVGRKPLKSIKDLSIPINSEDYQLINPKKEKDIQIYFGYYPNYKESEDLLNSPNFYNFFPMVSEIHGFRFIIHSNAFDNQVSRQELQKDNSVNRTLLSKIQEKLETKFEEIRSKDRKEFLSIYANLLLSDKPRKEWIYEVFYSKMLQYIRKNIPNENTYSDNSASVKLKGTVLDISPSDFGCSEIEWFYWKERDDKYLTAQALDSQKLGIEKWSIINLINYSILKGKINAINEWIKNASALYFKDNNNKSYLKFLWEIDKEISEDSLDSISQIKLYKFSNNHFYSINEIFDNLELVLISDKTKDIKVTLRLLGFYVSSLDATKNQNIYKCISDKLNDYRLFQAVCEKCKVNTLSPEHKKTLFNTLKTYENVALERLKKIELFKNKKETIKPLKSLLKLHLQVPKWLNEYKIHLTEYFQELDEYLMPESAIYQEIIYLDENFKAIVGHIEPEQVELFYKQVIEYYSLTDNAKGFNSHPFVFTGIEFTTTQEIFYNTTLKYVKNYTDFQRVIQKISQKKLPKKTLLSHFNDDKTPFYIKVDENITDLPLEGAYTQVEVSEILNFCVLNKEHFFKAYWIEQENDSYKVHKGTRVQFYTSNQDLAGILSEMDDFRPLPKSLYIPELNTIGLHTETESLLKQAVMTGVFDSRLMRLLKKSDFSDLKKYAISQIKRLDIQSDTEYSESAFEHLAIEIFIDQYKEDKEQIGLFRDKIFINGINVKEFSFRDKVTIKTDQKEPPEFSLATLIADYEGSSDLVTSVINQFKGLRKDLDLIFKTEEKQPAQVYDELRKRHLKIVNPEQGVFLMIHANLRNDSTVLKGFDFSAVQASEILNGLFEKGFGNILKQSVYPNFEVNEWIHPIKYAYGTEVIPDWVSDWLENGKMDSKLAYLEAIGLRSQNSELVQLRKALIGESDIDTEGLLAKLKTDTSALTNTLLWFSDSTTTIQKATKQEAILKNLYSKLPYNSKLPIPTVKNFEDSEIELLINEKYLFYFDEVDALFFKKIFNILTQKRYFYLSDIVPETWLKSLNPTKISLEDVVNIEKLKMSEKWEIPHLKRWEEIHNKSVSLYDGQIPYQKKFLGEIIDEFENGDVYSVENQIYVNVKADFKKLFLSQLSSKEQNSYYELFHAYSETVEPKEGLFFAEEQKAKAFQKFVEGRSIEEVKKIFEAGVRALSYNKPQEIEPTFDNSAAEINTGFRGEQIVYEYLLEKYQNPNRVKWVSEKNTGEVYGTPYDFEILTADEKEVLYYIDAKSTITGKYESDKIPIHIRNSEWQFMEQVGKDKYLIARVFNAVNPTFDDIVFLKMGIEEF